MSMPDPQSERSVLEQLAQDLLIERRRSRRWGIFFRLLVVALVGLGLAVALAAFAVREHPCLDQCTALVEIRGELEEGGRASAQRIVAGMQAAVKHRGIKGLILRINSPGGSPVQAGQIYDEVRRLRALHPGIPIHAVVEDIAASGGYYIAAAAEQIFVDKASIVGSIGVIMDGFGFTGTMDKLGVERRVLTAGRNKALMDPFAPQDAQQQAFVQGLLDDIHGQFIAAVRAGRGDRLKETPELFSGLVWNGRRAVDLGLADAFGSVESVAREVIKAEELVDFTPEDDLTDRFARRLGAVLAGEFLSTGRRLPAQLR
ncbi:MAG: S49 family peptidase [Betaproteobacteria bacterium]|nr:S49 family peptidase [Betaproteobacteria bacterium]MBK7590401.1 S49 family peptidase [Betaproteobacteria bacterium]MBK8689583.1 S49 family peptidase [Betaproteobacteria bacterium]MBK9676269.1 S49 family peptidase [Betaproteobacteria bacterium]